MRNRFSACVIALAHFSFAAQAYEIETETTFTAPNSIGQIKILSTADLNLFAPIIESFQASGAGLDVIYTTVSSSEVLQAVVVEGEVFDLVVSSAMDLQTKLANDGFAVPATGFAQDLVPDWAKWRDSVFAFTQEPAAIVLSAAAFQGLDIPRTRQDLISVLRAHPDRFQGRVGTYDIRNSGLGYMFATQDSRTSEVYWRLSEVFGQLETRLYCCSSDMIEDVSGGTIAVAYNVLGSYARARTDLADQIVVIEPDDFTTVMLRSALIPRRAPNPEGAKAFLDHLLEQAWGDPAQNGFPYPTYGADRDDVSKYRPIRMGPGLLVYLDRFKRDQFLDAWQNAVLQQ